MPGEAAQVRRRNPLHSVHFMQLEMPPDLLEVQRVMRVAFFKLWLNPGHGHGSPAERKMAMVIGRPLLKLNASTRGPRS
jgi:hypothetical protein